jgi:hypothetical protein
MLGFIATLMSSGQGINSHVSLLTLLTVYWLGFVIRVALHSLYLLDKLSFKGEKACFLLQQIRCPRNAHKIAYRYLQSLMSRCPGQGIRFALPGQL